ncbi:hypothetical protein HPB50_005704 [Hyalomma asiaticum]|uniref:Uncharacterized protein n=1 Tax=Hyalomma asiaticum TaxID=266040 RepID=A0ACB7RST2_HYAAI|nr:hypothetical protein HPB50_005704 [Hyalomma asiaticum]
MSPNNPPVELCEPAPLHVCPTTTAPGHAAGDVVVFDPSDQSCRKYRPGRNCLTGDNRFRDMDSCEAACTGRQHQPPCSEPASLHSCIPGIDTNSSAYYNLALYCLEVDRGSCLRGVGFSSKEECEHVCRGEGARNDAVECHTDDVRQCTLTTHLYHVAFIEGRCVQRVNICPKSVGFTSIDHCNKACRKSSKDVHPWWADTCNIFDTIGDADESSPTAAYELLDYVAKQALSASEDADRAKHMFVARVFSDSEFEESVAHYSQPWLPEFPTIDLDKSVTARKAYQTVFQAAYSCLQYYGVAMEQAMLDQSHYHTPFLELFVEMQEDVVQLLCKLLSGFERFELTRGADVERDVMPDEFRNIDHSGQRNLRDYLTLRDYAQLTRRISELFAYLRDHY